jgi:hypothetical protein
LREIKAAATTHVEDLTGFLERGHEQLADQVGARRPGCEAHKSPAIAQAPEIQHEALIGAPGAQARLAGCYEAGAACLGVAPDPAMACAWRGVRLASHAPDLSLADSARYASACADSDETVRQRAAIAEIDLVTRIYGREASERASRVTLADTQTVLYPSIETVRTRANLALAGAGDGRRLPAFTTSRPAADGAVVWSSCVDRLCLDGASPGWGGGLVRYRVTVAGAPGLAARLAGAGLDSPSVTDALKGPAPAELVQGPVCWRSGLDAGRGAYVEASRAPCRGR